MCWLRRSFNDKKTVVGRFVRPPSIDAPFQKMYNILCSGQEGVFAGRRLSEGGKGI